MRRKKIGERFRNVRTCSSCCIWDLESIDATDKWLEQKEFEKLDRKIKFLEEKGFSRREISRMVGIPYNEFGVVEDEVVNL